MQLQLPIPIASIALETMEPSSLSRSLKDRIVSGMTLPYSGLPIVSAPLNNCQYDL